MDMDAMSQLVHAEPPTARPAYAKKSSALLMGQLVTLVALTLWLYGPTLTHLVKQWWHDPNFSHGFFVPLFSAFVAWQERSLLAKIPLKPSWTGAGIVALALAVLVVGQTGAELFLARFSLLLLVCGLIVLFLGWNYLRALLFPIAFLVLMIPIPTIVFNQITFPLQLLATSPWTKKYSTSWDPANFCFGCISRRTVLNSPLTCSSLTFPLSAPVTPSTRPSTAFLELAGFQSRAHMSRFHCRGMPHFQRTVMSSPRGNPVS